MKVGFVIIPALFWIYVGLESVYAENISQLVKIEIYLCYDHELKSTCVMTPNDPSDPRTMLFKSGPRDTRGA